MSARPAARAALAVTALLGVVAAGGARAELPDVHALTGARVVVAPGRVLASATVVVRDGIIAGIGANLAVPPDARVWDLAGKTIYPGLIDAWVPRDWELEKAEDLPQAANRNRLVRAERSVLDRLRDEQAWKRLRAAGFTTALVVPGDGLFRGMGSIANLGDDPRAAVLRPDVVQAVAVRTPRRWNDYPDSLMGAVALFRQTLLDARWHRQAHAAFRANPAQERPLYDASLAALEPAAFGEMPVAFETTSVLDELRCERLAKELGLRAWLVGSGEEYRRIDEVKAQTLPLILPVAFPERPEIGENDDHTVGLEKLRAWDDAPANPARLAEAGQPFALTAFRQKEPKAIFKNLARAVERGLDADRALAALTQVPAEFLGISGRAGSVEVGKMANLVVVEGDLLVAEPKIEAVWIDGRRYETGDEGGGDKPRRGRRPGEEVAR